MKANTRFGLKFVAALCAAAAICLLDHRAWASDAIWIGGASGDMNTPANWDGAIATSGATMMFTNDCAVSLSADLTANSVFSDCTAGGDLARRFDKNVTINLNNHTLRTNGAGTQYWRARGSTLTFTGGTFLNVQDGGTTNLVCADHSTLSYGMSLVVTGSGTKFVSSFANRAVLPPDRLGTRFRLLDGAEAVGSSFSFGGCNSTNEISGGATLRYNASTDSGAYGFVVGGQRDSYAYTSSRDELRISGSGTVVEPLATAKTNGFFIVGYGENTGGSRLVVEDGATLVLPGSTAVGHGGCDSGKNRNYLSCSNELVVTGSGTTMRSDRTNTDNPMAVGRHGSFNRLLVDDGAFAQIKALSCGGETKGALHGNSQLAIMDTSSYTSAWNVVTVRGGSTLDAWAVLAGNQHTDSKLVVAQYGAQCYSNRIEIIEGAHLYATNSSSLVGAMAPYFGNVLTISGAGTTAIIGNGSNAITIGQAGSCSNRMEVLDGAVVEVDGAVFLGNGNSTTAWGYGPDGTTIVRGIGNELRVEGAGSSLTELKSNRGMYFGGVTNGNANVIWVGDGATMTWPSQIAISGYDNAIVVSNGTLNLGSPIRSVNDASQLGGRTRFVFAGAAPKLVSSSASQSKFQNGAILRFEIPAAGWSEAPLQATGTSNNVQFDDDTELEVDVKAFKGGEVPLVTAGRGLSISSGLLESWNAGIEESQASVRLSADGKTLILKKSRSGLTLIVR